MYNQSGIELQFNNIINIEEIYSMTEDGDLVRLYDIDEEFIIDFEIRYRKQFLQAKGYIVQNECYMDKHTGGNIDKGKKVLERRIQGNRMLDADQSVHRRNF